MNKIQKPSFNKVHKHAKCYEHQHNCGGNHKDFHEELFGQSQEVPAVFSYSTSFKSNKKVTGSELQTCLVNWIESIKQWVSHNKYFIGHIKIFAESREDFNLWLSTTGKNINIKGSTNNENSNIESIKINMTMIIFGTDEKTLRSVTLESLSKNLSHHSE